MQCITLNKGAARLLFRDRPNGLGLRNVAVILAVTVKNAFPFTFYYFVLKVSSMSPTSGRTMNKFSVGLF